MIKTKAFKLEQIIQVPEKATSLTLVERDDEHWVYVGAQNSQALGLDSKLREVVDSWSVGDHITCLDSCNGEEGGVVFAIGT